ncbi:hypothetical protein OpiT1DRAFT_05674 [Opitutaceae bacterium TAV1]|nr:hypothetical protein OpiT1DRAFT_05674 [Opitutaceae bacterium TAV1]
MTKLDCQVHGARLTNDRVAAIRRSQARWVELAEEAERWASFVEERRAAGVEMMDSPDVLRNQAETYRRVVRAYALELEVGKAHCACCLKPFSERHSSGLYP